MKLGKCRYGILGLVGIIAVMVAGVTVAAVTLDTGGDDQPITGSALAECSAAALAAHPGGTVTETEVGDDGAAYGVEVRLADGSEVEVNLDENCQVIGQEIDDEDGPGGEEDDD